MERIAVLLAVYNGREWIDEQLNSILQQKNVDLDVYISVDLSEDDSYDYLVSKYSNFKNIIFLPYGERFGAAGENFYNLIRNVSFDKYDYVSFSDQDDIWIDNKLRTAINEIEINEVSAYSGNVIAFWADGRKCLINKAQPQVKYDYIFEAAGPGCTYVFTRDLAENFKKFVCSVPKLQKLELHDWALYAFARSNNFKWFIDSNSFMLYRQHASNQVGANNSLKAWIKRINLVRNNWYRTEVTKASSLVTSDRAIAVKRNISLGYLGNLLLAFNIFNLRRRNRDRIMLLLLLLSNSF